MATTETENDRHVLVTDYHRGLCYGRLVHWDPDRRIVELADARAIWYWAVDEEARGLFGLAVAGPAAGSKIGPIVSRVIVAEVAKIIDCGPAAIDRFASAGWDV